MTLTRPIAATKPSPRNPACGASAARAVAPSLPLGRPCATLAAAQSKTPAWLKVKEFAQRFSCSEDHVSHLIAGGDIDAVIDIRCDGASRPAYRLLAASVARFERVRTSGKQPETDLEAQLLADAKALPIVLSAAKTAAYLCCSDQHILSLARHFLDIAASGSARCCLRVPRAKLFAWIVQRRVA